MFGLFGFVSLADAEDTCECYCNIEGTGATKYPDESTKVTSSACQELCADKGYSVATCAFKPNQKPQYNVMCFTPDECTSQGGIPTANGSGTQTQPGECKQGMFYCYPDPSIRKETTLQVSIGGLSVTGDLGEYVSSAYKWMLGASTTIAIVFLMVAGLRWALGGLSAEQVGKAKKTITNALIGLVLLMSTYLILLTVNPQLLKLQVPAFPLIKPVSLVGEGSCGYLKGVWGTSPYLVKNGAPYDSPYSAGGDPGKGYTVANETNEENCGSVADVTKDPDGNTVVDDMTCTFDYCATEGQKCFTSLAGGQCVGCKEIISGNQFFTPSSSICSSLSLRTTFVGQSPQIQQCFWTKALYLNTADFSSNYNTWNDGACAMLIIDCKNIQKCEDYDTKAKVSNNSASVDLEVLVQAGMYGSVNFGDKSLKTVCEEDPCGVGAKTGKTCSNSFNTGLGLSLEALFEVLSGNDCESL